MTNQSLEALLKAGDTERARTQAEAILRERPEDRTALLTLAKLATFNGELQEAEKLLARILKDGKEDTDSLLVKAAIDAQRNDVQAARAGYERIIREAKPPRAEAYYGLGYIHLSEDDFAGARTLLQKAVDLDPGVAAYRYHLARTLLALEELQAALPHLEKALELNPLHPPTYMSWAVVLQHLDKLEAAEDILRQGLKVMPDEPGILNVLAGVLVARGNVPGAVEIVQALVEKHPTNPAFQSNLARLMMATGHKEEALKLCADLEASGHATAQTKFIEGMVLEGMDPPDVEGAIAAYGQAMEMDPKDWAAANNLGNLLLATDVGSPEENLNVAIDALEEACRRVPNRIEPKLNLAIAYARKGAKDMSKSLAKEVLADATEKDHRDQAERLIKSLG